MFKTYHIAIFSIITLSICVLFQLKFKVQDLRQEVSVLAKKIHDEKEAIRVLRAEWAYVNNPERIMVLAKKYLDLKEVTMDQVAEVSRRKIQQDPNQVKVAHKSVKWNYKSKDLKKYAPNETQNLLATFRSLN